MKITGINIGKTNIKSTYDTEFDINPLEILAVELLSVDAPGDKVYTGIEQTPKPTARAIVDGKIIGLELDKDYILSYNNNINAGVATLIATGIGNFKGTVSTTWNILPAEISVTKKNQTYVYDGKLHGDGIEVTTIGDTPTITYSITGDDTIPKIKNVSESSTIYYEVSAPNHKTITGSYTIDIIPKIVNLLWTETEWVYDGKIHYGKCIVTNLVDGDICNFYYDNNFISSIGSKTVTITGLDNLNYELPINDLSYIITIYPGMFYKVSGNWTPVKSVYKKVSGSWVKQEFNSAFSTSGNYVKIS